MRERVPAERKAKDQDHSLKSGNEMQLIAEGLFARLVAEQVARRIGPWSSADQCPEKQRGLADPPGPGFGRRLVDTESGKGDEVHREASFCRYLLGGAQWRVLLTGPLDIYARWHLAVFLSIIQFQAWEAIV